MAKASKQILSPEQQSKLRETLKNRFAKNPNRHQGISWDAVAKRLQAYSDKLFALHQMEETGGEPDVIGVDNKTGEIIFADCSAESPAGRRSLCYDRQGLESRKEHQPVNSAVDLANEMGISLLTEEQYRHLQTLGKFDTKTSSWLLTPQSIRKHGGAIFGDYRYEAVFIYHNGAQSYYAARGFRGLITV